MNIKVKTQNRPQIADIAENALRLTKYRAINLYIKNKPKEEEQKEVLKVLDKEQEDEEDLNVVEDEVKDILSSFLSRGINC